MRCFSSNNVEGVAENWVEVEVSWMELDGAGWSWVVVEGVGGGEWSWVELGERFSNTQNKIAYTKQNRKL